MDDVLMELIEWKEASSQREFLIHYAVKDKKIYVKVKDGCVFIENSIEIRYVDVEVKNMIEGIS